MNKLAEYLGCETTADWYQMLFFFSISLGAGLTALILLAGGWL